MKRFLGSISSQIRYILFDRTTFVFAISRSSNNFPKKPFRKREHLYSFFFSIDCITLKCATYLVPLTHLRIFALTNKRLGDSAVKSSRNIKPSHGFVSTRVINSRNLWIKVLDENSILERVSRWYIWSSYPRHFDISPLQHLRIGFHLWSVKRLIRIFGSDGISLQLGRPSILYVVDYSGVFISFPQYLIQSLRSKRARTEAYWAVDKHPRKSPAWTLNIRLAGHQSAFAKSI